MNEWWNQYFQFNLSNRSEFWLGFLLFRQKCTLLHLKASSAVIVSSTSFTRKACHSRKRENSLSFDQVQSRCYLNSWSKKKTWKSNYSTVRLFFLVWSSFNFPSVFLCIIDCVIWLLDWFLVHCRSSFLPQ